MNKYLGSFRQAPHHPSPTKVRPLLRLISGFNHVMLAALVLFGLGSLCYKLIGPNGWLATLPAPDWIMPGLVGVAVPIGTACILVAGWYALARNARLGKHSDVPIYLLMAVGLYFLFRLISTGSL